MTTYDINANFNVDTKHDCAATLRSHRASYQFVQGGHTWLHVGGRCVHGCGVQLERGRRASVAVAGEVTVRRQRE